MSEKAYTVTIKKGNLKLTVGRDDIVVINETPDGVVFEFREGLQLLNTDVSMPMDTKQRLKLNIDTMTKGNAEIDLLNYLNPVTLKFD